MGGGKGKRGDRTGDRSLGTVGGFPTESGLRFEGWRQGVHEDFGPGPVRGSIPTPPKLRQRHFWVLSWHHCADTHPGTRLRGAVGAAEGEERYIHKHVHIVEGFAYRRPKKIIYIIVGHIY